ncbi:MAG: helix-turn-helix domain-containing protein [Elusimicrobia bacterium]|nr:helix-turn-helix domain-containing protein [Elusimicrobiota bacterium]
MSQAQLARRCGIPQPHLARLEAGKCGVQWRLPMNFRRTRLAK